MDDIGKGLKFVRVAAGIKQGDMAKRLGISQNYLSLLENNRCDPSIKLLRIIAKEFGVSIGFIMCES